VNDYCAGALDFLRHAYDPERALFSYSTRLYPDGSLVNDFAHPQTIRYTVNTFLGLSEAVRFGGPVDWVGDLGEAVRRFADVNRAELTSPADRGLLLVLLAEVEPDHPDVGPMLDAIAAAVADDRPSLDMQELAWMLWGAVATLGDARAERVAHRIFDLIRRRYVNQRTGLPRHTPARYRANIVSFGSLVYFLRATYEYGERFGDATARALFDGGVRKALAIQGPDGEWPWMIDNRTGVPIDLYPVFTVHQDSMAMLFLQPAAAAGIEGAEEAMALSYGWNHGRNELGESLVLDEPCRFVYRSIERDEGNARLRRYLRALGRPARDYPPRASSVRINRECRSYHLGWVLYTWSGAPAMPALPAEQSEVTA
jgi:hypothetical protein